MRPDERPATAIIFGLLSLGFGLIAVGAHLGATK